MSEESDLSVIQRFTRVLSDTYAALPVTNLRTGELAYATDRRTLYRWSGAAWEDISIYSDSGAIADIPAAATLPEGSLYYATDTLVLYQLHAGAWVAIVAQTGWSLIGSDSPSGAASADITIAVHDLVKVLFRFVASANGELNLRLNNDASADYHERRIVAAALQIGNALTESLVIQLIINEAAAGELMIEGLHTNGIKCFALVGMPHARAAGSPRLLDGGLVGDAADLTVVSLIPSAGTITGEMRAYGFNF